MPAMRRDSGIDDNTTSLDQVLWNVVKNPEDFLHDRSCVLQTILLGFCFARISCK
jgi:hypothetical protein